MLRRNPWRPQARHRSLSRLRRRPAAERSRQSEAAAPEPPSDPAAPSTPSTAEPRDAGTDKPATAEERTKDEPESVAAASGRDAAPADRSAADRRGPRCRVPGGAAGRIAPPANGRGSRVDERCRVDQRCRRSLAARRPRLADRGCTTTRAAAQRPLAPGSIGASRTDQSPGHHAATGRHTGPRSCGTQDIGHIGGSPGAAAIRQATRDAGRARAHAGRARAHAGGNAIGHATGVDPGRGRAVERPDCSHRRASTRCRPPRAHRHARAGIVGRSASGGVRRRPSRRCRG